MYQLNKKTKDTIEKHLGVSIDNLKNMDFENIDSLIEKKTKKKITFLQTNDSRLLGRGSVFAFLNRFFDFDDVDKKINKI